MLAHVLKRPKALTWWNGTDYNRVESKEEWGLETWNYIITVHLWSDYGESYSLEEFDPTEVWTEWIMVY